MLRLRPLAKNVFLTPRYPCLHNYSRLNLSSTAAAEAAPLRRPKKIPIVPQPGSIARKKDVPQSPWKMNFLVKLIRNLWYPDALAQLTFSPKHRAVDVTKILKRACALARVNHQAIPEELIVKEIFVTKGASNKKLRIMGRGRSGVGYMRKTHVTIKLEVINFEEKIKKAKTTSQKVKWYKIQQHAIKKRLLKEESEKVTEIIAAPIKA